MPQGIPPDPRQRTKNHGRLVVTIWCDIPDDVLNRNHDRSAPDAIRRALEQTMGKGSERETVLDNAVESMNDCIDAGFPIITDIIFDVGQ